MGGTPTPTATATPSQTPVATLTPTATQTPTLTATQTPSATFTPSPTFTPTPVPSLPITIDYVYDPLNRLTSANYSDGRSFSYQYDAVGNVLQYSQTQSGSTVTTTYHYNHANQLTTAQADNSPILWQYVFDPNGRLTEVLPDGVPANGAKRYAYNTAGYLTKTETHDGSGYQLQAEMLYDGLGQRLSMTAYALGTSVTTNYTLDLTQNGHPLSATSNGNTTYYLYGLDPIAEFTTSWSYSLPDGTNTPRQLTNSAGTITLAGRYTPWGDALDYAGTGNFTFGYFGGLMDSATGLLYVGNGQYYDPTTGRFLTRDAQPDKTHPYVPWGDPIGALLAPLALAGLIYGRKRKKNGFDYFIIVLFVAVGVGVGLSACGSTPAPSGTSQPPTIPPSGASTPARPTSNSNVTATPPVQSSGTSTSILDQIFVTPCPTPTWMLYATQTPIPTLPTGGLTSDDIKILAVLIAMESSSGAVPDSVSYMKAWALLNLRSVHQKYPLHQGQNLTPLEDWKAHERALLDEKGINGTLDQQKTKLLEWYGWYSNGVIDGVTADRFASIERGVNQAVGEWALYGPNSGADPIHGTYDFTDASGLKYPNGLEEDQYLYQIPNYKSTIMTNWKEMERFRNLFEVTSPLYVFSTDPYTGLPVYTFTRFKSDPRYTLP